MSRALRIVILSSTVLLGALSAGLVMALRQRPHPSLRQIRAVLFDNWGVYSLFQLELGLFFAAAWILCVHRRKPVALLWIAGIAVTGHIATLAYILVRACSAQTVADVFMPQRAPRPVEEAAVPVIQPCSAAFNVELPEPAAQDADAADPAPVNDPA